MDHMQGNVMRGYVKAVQENAFDNWSTLTAQQRVRWPRFCTTGSERVYVTAQGCETGFAATRGL